MKVLPGTHIKDMFQVKLQIFTTIKFRSSLPVEVTAGSRATDIRELRQTRKGAAVTVLDVCRGGAWLSLVPAILMVLQNVRPPALSWFYRTLTYCMYAFTPEKPRCFVLQKFCFVIFVIFGNFIFLLGDKSILTVVESDHVLFGSGSQMASATV